MSNPIVTTAMLLRTRTAVRAAINELTSVWLYHPSGCVCRGCELARDGIELSNQLQHAASRGLADFEPILLELCSLDSETVPAPF